MRNETFGWRGKIGLIMPSVQTITEPLYNRLAPEGVAFFASRVLVEQSVMANHKEMEREAFRAGKELSTGGMDGIAYCCTVSGMLKGIDGDREFCRTLEHEIGVPTTSTLSSILAALDVLELKKLVLISPYMKEMHTAEEKFFESNGFEVLASHSMEIDRGKKFAQVTPGEIYRVCRENWNEGADGLLISCMNFNAMPCIGVLERDLGKPVISSHSATLWNILRNINVCEAIPGYGKLLTIDFHNRASF